MSTPLYDALVAKVRDWSNRDTESLPDSILKDSLAYASETAYRELRVQGMEKVYNFIASQKGNSFTVPSDLKEYISLRQLSKATQDAAGTSTFSFIAEANQTSFSGLDSEGNTLKYVPGALLVTLNGVFLTPTTDYVASDGVGITLTTSAFVTDVLNVVAFNSIVDSASVTTFNYTATSGQTTFSGLDINNKTLSYKLNRVLVTVNGLYQTPVTSFTATDKTSVVLTSPAVLNDDIQIVSFNETSVYSSNTHNIETQTVVYDNRTDYRSFISDSSNKYNTYLWTRQGDKIIVSPDFKDSDVIELYYYSDGSNLGSEYAVTSANFQADLLESSTQELGTPLYFLTSVTTPVPDEDVPSENSGGSYTNAFYFKGKEQPHYLRDNQERLLIYVALSFINDYLGEDNQSQKYYVQASELIQRLNNAEVFKQASGGNLRTNFEGPLI